MSAVVSVGRLICRAVRTMDRPSWAGFTPTQTQVINVANRIAVPDASGWNVHTAAYGLL